MTQRPTPQLVRERFAAAECLSGGSRLREKQRRGPSVVFRPLRFRVQADHAPGVELSFEAAQNGHGIRGQSEPIKENRFVLRKELEIVLQDHEVVLADFRIGRIRVLHVDGTVT